MSVSDGTVYRPLVLNTVLLWRVLEQIRTHPEEWNQSHWVRHTRCGTRYCLAGWAYTLHTGAQLRDSLPMVDALVPMRARRALGLTREQAARLFEWTSVARRVGGVALCHRHPTFAELVDRVAAVTGFRFDPDAPPTRGPEGDGGQPQSQPASDAQVLALPVQRQPTPQREMACVG